MTKHVFSVMLRVDAEGWSGAPPLLPGPPVSVHGPGEAPTGFSYDVDLGSTELTIDAACNALIAAIEHEVGRSASVLRDPAFRRRCIVDVAISVTGDIAMFSYTWPADFLARLGGLGIGICASHYLERVFKEVMSEPRTQQLN